MIKLYGKKTRCLWCGESDKKNYNEITMTIKFANPQQEKGLVCSEECGRNLSEACKFIEKGIFIYIIGLFLSILVISVSLFKMIVGGDFMLTAALGIFLLGLTLIATPFVTPQTVKMLGLKKGMITGRILGIIALLFALILFFNR